MANQSPLISNSADEILPPVPAAKTTSASWRGFLQTSLLYLAAAVVSLSAVSVVMHLGQADLRAPFNYEGDALLNITLAKIIVDKGWYLHTDALGAPAGMNLEDYPVGDNLVCTVMKVMSFFTSDPVLITNLFFLATFPLVALSALHTTRRFGISAGPALLISLLYTWLPYHFWRGTVHLYFTAYFLVPPAILVAWWVSSRQLFARRERLWFSLGLALLLGCNMAYYPFFACFLLLVAAAMALVQGDRRHAAAGGVLILTITLVLLLNLLPNILYAHAHGAAASGRRYSFEAELNGLKITQLLLPVTGHRLPALALLKAGYNNTHPLVNENDWVALGFIGGAGFVFLVCWVLFSRFARPYPSQRSPAPGRLPNGFSTLIDHLGVFNLATLLLATMGGFSILFALLITPQIRAYNRICVFTAFFSLLAVAVGLETIARRWIRSRLAAAGFTAALILLGLLGLLDQTGADAAYNWTKLANSFHDDQEYFAQVQKTLPPNAMIFELPYEPFPEYGSTMYQMIEYAEFRPYVHTHGLRWSYGVIKGRPGDDWERTTAALPPDQMLDILRRAGFGGIYVDCFGYQDRAADLGSKLQSLLGAPPLKDTTGRFFLFNLHAPAGPAPSLESILPLAPPAWVEGFYDLETSSGQPMNWRWCAADGEMRLVNDTGHPRRVHLEATLRCGTGPSVLHIRGGKLLDEDLNIDPAGIPFSRVVELPPGNSTVHFHCDASPLPKSVGDPRTLVWRVDNFVLSKAD